MTTTVAAAPIAARPGQRVRVETPDGYVATGRLIGLTRAGTVEAIRVLGEDKLERQIPLPATITVLA